MGNKGNNTTTSTTQPNAAAMSAYNDILARAQNVASTQYQPYTGELVPGMNDQQNRGIAGINQYANFAQPYIQEARGYAERGGTALTAGDIQNYLNPYTQNVVNATEAQFQNQNAQQQQQVMGNAAAQGALGGDRRFVAQANLAGQQQLAQNPTIAGLYSSGYQQAVQTAEQQKQDMANAGYAIGNLGVAGQNAGLSGASAMFGAGNQQWQNQYLQDQSKYGQFQQQQAFPYQQLQWLAGIGTGVGSQMGGTSTTTAPPPNPWAQWAGLGMAGLGAAGKIWGANRGGGVEGYDAGGSIGGEPYSGVGGYIPGMQITRGRGPPPPLGMPQQSQGLTSQQISGIGDAFKGWKDTSGNSPEAQNAIANSLAIVSPNYGGLGPLYRHGGGIMGYADGGSPDYRLPEGAGSAWGDVGGLTPEALAAVGARLQYAPEPTTRGISARRALSENDFTTGDPIWSGRADPAGTRYTELGAANPVNVPASGERTPMNPNVRGIGPVADASDGSSGGDGTVLPPQRGGIGQWTPEQRQRMMDVITGQNQPPPVAGVGYQSPPPTSPWLGVMAAGLGMMASRSPFLGTAIGEGGLAGLQAYSTQRQQEVAEAEKKATIDQRAQQLAQHADEARKTLASHTLGLMQAQEHQEVPAGYRRTATGLEAIPGGPEDIPTIQAKTKAKIEPLDPSTKEVGARQVINGDMSPLANRRGGQQGAAEVNEIRNRATKILIEEHKMTPTQAADYLSYNLQKFKSAQIGANAEERVRGTREANLNIILKATEAAIPAAIEESAKVWRTGFVPLNKIIQKGEIMTSDPNLRTFGMANLQLAEHWARAMNPTGVMRESDRDKALDFLGTATSHETYVAMVMQLKKQIEREKAAVASGRSIIPGPLVPGGKAPSEPEGTQSTVASATAPAAAPPPAVAPVRVTTRAEAKALPVGTRYITPDGNEFTR